MGDNPEENDPPKAKRKKELTGNEILAKLKQNENDVDKVAREMILSVSEIFCHKKMVGFGPL